MVVVVVMLALTVLVDKGSGFWAHVVGEGQPIFIPLASRRSQG